MDSFCNGEPLWDSDLTWNSSWPRFTDCFQHTVLVWIPCSWLWITSPFYLSHLHHIKPAVLSSVAKHVLELVSCAILVVVSVVNTILYSRNFSDKNNSGYIKADNAAPAVQAITFLLALVLITIERTKGLVTSPVLPIFWVLELVSGVVPFYSYIILQIYKDSVAKFSLFYIHYFLVLKQCFINCFAENAEEPPSGKNPCPETQASFLSRITFWWSNKLLLNGYRKTLTEDDVSDLHPREQSRNVVPRFLHNWNHQVKMIQKRTLNTDSPTKKAEQDVRSEKGHSKPSLIRSLWRTFAFEMLQAQFWKLLCDVLILTNPLLLRELIAFTEDTTVQDWKGYALAAILFSSICLQSFLFQALWHQSTSLGLRIRASVISTIFRKIAVSLYLLYNTLGAAMFAALGFLILLVPLNGLIMTKLGRYQTQLMVQKDMRMKILNEVLIGMKIVKLHAWEPSFQAKIMAIRDCELSILWKTSLIIICMSFTWTVAPYVVSLVTFLTYIYTADDHYINPQTAFVAISLFNILRFVVNRLPMALKLVVKAAISIQRINNFLNLENLDETSVVKCRYQEDPVIIKNASFTWNPALGPSLKDINLNIKDGQLIAVVGQVGSGKSSLLSAILGEVTKIKGEISLRSNIRISYVPQQAWIQNDTLQNNILFGKFMNRELYNRVVECCALRPDLEMLPAGDETEIGERGINLSAGQKQRVSLARAVYSDANIYLFDDPLSAVDSNVGKHIFDRIICKTGLLRHKTRVMVTHGVQWLPDVDTVVVMTNGQVSEIGSYDELFAQFLGTHSLESEDEGEDKKAKRLVLQRIQLLKTDDGSEAAVMERRRQKAYEEKNKSMAKSKSRNAQSKKKLIEEEKVQVGRVKWSVFMDFGRAVGLKFVLLILLLYTVYEAAAVTANIWLSMWTDDAQLNDLNVLPANSTERLDKNNYYLGIYGGLGAAQTLFVMTYSVIASVRFVQASKILHNRMLVRIFRAPLTYFDTTPIGRIVNRFSQDIKTVDNDLPISFRLWLNCSLLLLATVIAISYSTPVILALVVPLFILYLFIQRFYIPTSRQVKRLESKTRSPIYSHFGETVLGATVIRAYGVAERFILESEKRVDNNQRFAFAGYTVQRWLSIRLEFLGNIIVPGAAIFAVLSRDNISGGLAGLSLSYALEITGTLNWLVRKTSDLETEIVAVERIKELTEILPEAPWTRPRQRSRPKWPQSGVIKFQNYSTRYRKELDFVLRDVSCTINSGEKVGIVGRTGAGKSSMALGLFRLIEAEEGEIIIDGLDISQIGLHDLRKNLTILPQDPVIFAGSLRVNLDPFNQFSDHQLWNALEHAHLKGFVQTLPGALEHECGEGGENLSVGQRQLLCLARALLQKNRILVLDEATAAVDMETDDLIQQTIRSEFKDCTVLTIAHRLNTVMDYDRILVINNGMVVDFDSPHKLLENPAGIFYKMAKDAGLA